MRKNKSLDYVIGSVSHEVPNRVSYQSQIHKGRPIKMEEVKTIRVKGK